MTSIQDVAKHAGVSIATVSRVLNGTAFVNDAIKHRVEDAIQALQYQPFSGARTLRGNRSKIIGLMVSDLQNPFFMSLIQGVEDQAHHNGYSVLLCHSNEDPKRERQYLKVLFAERVAGVIIIPTRERMVNELEPFHMQHIPIVAVDRRINDPVIDAILVDNIHGSKEAVSHLIANGYHRIGVIVGPKTLTTGRDRLEGYYQALQIAGITPDLELERSGPFRREIGVQLAQELLELPSPPDALFVGNNLLSQGALEAIFQHHLRVPDDLGFASYDELPWLSPAANSLTIVSQPVYELGSTAALRLFHRIQNDGTHSRQEVVLSPTLRIGESSRKKISTDEQDAISPPDHV